MKRVATLLLTMFTLHCLAQEEKIHLEARIVDAGSNPVPDAYIINSRSLEKAVSKSNGVFGVWAFPSDTLVFSHVSYHRKVFTVFDLMVNPIVTVEIFSTELPGVTVSPGEKNDMDRANENLMFLNDLKVPKFEKIKAENNPVKQTVTENDRLQRTEASSLIFTKFSPSEQIGKLFRKAKRRKAASEYSSQKKQKQP
jgi:hypothetical protein